MISVGLFYFSVKASCVYSLHRYLLQYQEPIPCEQLVTALCDIKQAYTQFGGKIHCIYSV